MAACAGRIFVYGGKGALGAACVSHFKTLNYWVGSIDIAPNESADANVLVDPNNSWIEQKDNILNKVEGHVTGNKLDAVLCVAGGWAGGNASSQDFIKNADMMWKQSVFTSAIAASIAANHLKEGGLLSLTGAAPALSATPGMIGYGMAKAAVHQLTKSLASDKGGLPVGSLAVAILPVTLDTPMNRKFMASADFTSWTPLEFVAKLLQNWIENKDRPANGSLIKLTTKSNNTTCTVEPAGELLTQSA